VYVTDPDAPRELSPLARFGVNVAEGDRVAGGAVLVELED